MKKNILIILIIAVLAFIGGVAFNRYNDDKQSDSNKNNISTEESDNSNKNSQKNNETDRIKAGEYYLEYGNYKNQSYTIEQGGANYILNKDGTFFCTNFQGTAEGTYTVSLETYTNSADTYTDWLICFSSLDKNNVGANCDYIICGNNTFSGIQDGGTLKYIGK